MRKEVVCHSSEDAQRAFCAAEICGWVWTETNQDELPAGALRLVFTDGQYQTRESDV